MTRPSTKICIECLRETARATKGLCSRCYGRHFYYKHHEKQKAYQRKLIDTKRHDPIFKAARIASSKKWRDAHPEHVEYAKKYHLAKKYGISAETKDKMLLAQGGNCAICNANIINGGVNGSHLDHCHRTARIRGILCDKCNRGLGQFKDDAGRLISAAFYIRQHDSEPSWISPSWPEPFYVKNT